MDNLPFGQQLPVAPPNARDAARKHIAKVRRDLHFCTKDNAYMLTADVRWLCVLLEQFVMEVEKQNSIILSHERRGDR